MKMQNKVAIVTGSAEGIGKAVALLMVEEGAKVVIADIQSDKGASVVQQITDDKGDAIFVLCDIGKSDQVKKMVDRTIECYGRIDILVNNAAIDFQSAFVDMDEASWQKVLNINLTGAFRCNQYVVPHMIKSGGGSIVNLASVQAFMGFPTYTAYATAKGGILSMTKQLAVELAPFHIRVNSISPGAINTPMTQKDLDNAEDPDTLMKEYESQHAMGRIGQPEEVAKAVIFLACGESSFITGIDIKVDGGLVINP